MSESVPLFDSKTTEKKYKANVVIDDLAPTPTREVQLISFKDVDNVDNNTFLHCSFLTCFILILILMYETIKAKWGCLLLSHGMGLSTLGVNCAFASVLMLSVFRTRNTLKEKRTIPPNWHVPSLYCPSEAPVNVQICEVFLNYSKKLLSFNIFYEFLLPPFHN